VEDERQSSEGSADNQDVGMSMMDESGCFDDEHVREYSCSLHARQALGDEMSKESKCDRGKEHDNLCLDTVGILRHKDHDGSQKELTYTSVDHA
jgi:hypothetical protein